MLHDHGHAVPIEVSVWADLRASQFRWLVHMQRLQSEWVTTRRPDLADYGLPTEAPYNLGFAFQSKAWDASAPRGPFLATADEVDPNDLDFEFRVNGKLQQSRNTVR